MQYKGMYGNLRWYTAGLPSMDHRELPIPAIRYTPTANSFIAKFYVSGIIECEVHDTAMAILGDNCLDISYSVPAVEIYNWCEQTFGPDGDRWTMCMYEPPVTDPNSPHDRYTRSTGTTPPRVSIRKIVTEIFFCEKADLMLFKLRWYV